MAVDCFLAENAYGKAQVRVVKVLRSEDRHDLIDFTVGIRLTGDFGAAYVHGENSAVLPTDTLKNTVYALAARHDVAQPEELGWLLVEHFLETVGAARTVEVELLQRPWARLTVGGQPHTHAFEGSTGERRLAWVRGEDTGERSVAAGLGGLLVLKTTGSAFTGFPKDEYTSLEEAQDRLLATELEARWEYGEGDYGGVDLDFGKLHDSVRTRLVETFAEHDESQSVQHTLWAMGEAVLETRSEVDEVRLILPNKHHWRVDLSAFGLDNPDTVFVATDEPFGLIEGTVQRR